MMPTLELCAQTYWAQMVAAFMLGATVVALITLVAWPREVRRNDEHERGIW